MNTEKLSKEKNIKFGNTYYSEYDLYYIEQGLNAHKNIDYSSRDTYIDNKEEERMNTIKQYEDLDRNRNNYYGSDE